MFLLLRIYSEPFLWKSVFSNTINRYLLGRVLKNPFKKLRFEDNTLCSFVNQAANIEQVVLIMTGIKQSLLAQGLTTKSNLEFDQHDFKLNAVSKWDVDRVQSPANSAVSSLFKDLSRQ